VFFNELKGRGGEIDAVVRRSPSGRSTTQTRREAKMM
jgi:hypothetical protein